MWITSKSDKYRQDGDLLFPLPIPPWSYPSPHQLHKPCRGNRRWNCEEQYKDLYPHLGMQWGSTASRTPGTNIIKEQVVPALNPDRFSTAPLQTASGRHTDGSSSWPQESRRSHNNTQGTKSKTGTLDTKHKSTSLLEKLIKLISRVVWKVTAVNINAFTAHSSSLSHLNWVQIYSPLSTYFSHMVHRCKYFTLFFKKRMWFKSKTQCWYCSLNPQCTSLKAS